MLGNYRVAAQLVASRVVLSSTELVRVLNSRDKINCRGGDTSPSAARSRLCCSGLPVATSADRVLRRVLISEADGRMSTAHFM
jgi:hypothetical protein